MGKKYPWVSCKDASKGMFCTICQKWGHPTAGSRGAWTNKGLTDWCHATELLIEHSEIQSQRCYSHCWYGTAGRAWNSILELQYSAAAIEATCRAERNRSILLKLLRSIYFLAKNKIPHATTYPNLIVLQVANGDRLPEEHITQGSSNAQYT